MSNPRPCECGLTHQMVVAFHPYRPKKRTEPLRARRTWSLERMQEVMRSTGYTPRVENTYHLRAERTPPERPVAVSAWTPPDGKWVPVRALRDFLDAEQQKAAVDREGCSELRDRYYYNGVYTALAKVRERFCD